MIVTLGGLSYSTQSWSCVKLHMHVSDAYVCGISGQNSFRGGECETPENPNFRKRVKR